MKWLTKDDFTYNKYGDNMAKFLKDEWGVIMNDYDLQEYIDIYREGYWDTERENYAIYIIVLLRDISCYRYRKNY